MQPNQDFPPLSNWSSPQPVGEVQAELDAARSETFTATQRILSAAEEIDDLAKALENKDLAKKLQTLVGDIFTASTFQDITGQRLSKVAKLVNTSAQAASQVVSADNPASLLNGPQLNGEAPDQDEIDRLFAGE
jgi:chemotaxis protein CheZ